MERLLCVLLFSACTMQVGADRAAGTTCDEPPADPCAGIICAEGETCDVHGVCVLDCAHVRCLQLMTSCAAPTPPASFAAGLCTTDEAQLPDGACVTICGASTCPDWWKGRGGSTRRVP